MTGVYVVSHLKSSLPCRNIYPRFWIDHKVFLERITTEMGSDSISPTSSPISLLHRQTAMEFASCMLMQCLVLHQSAL